MNEVLKNENLDSPFFFLHVPGAMTKRISDNTAKERLISRFTEKNFAIHILTRKLWVTVRHKMTVGNRVSFYIFDTKVHVGGPEEHLIGSGAIATSPSPQIRPLNRIILSEDVLTTTH